VDNGSEDGSAVRALASFPGVILHRLPTNAGLSAARNVGLRRAATELVLFVDHDIYLEPECLERLDTARRERDATAACPRIRLHPEREIVQAEGADLHFIGALALRHGFRMHTDLVPAAPASVGAMPGGCMLVHRERVLEAGGFEELIFFYFEDLEFSFRLRSLGHDFVAVPDAEVFHDRGAGSPGLAFRGRGLYPAARLRLTLRHRLFVLLVHYQIRTLVVLAPVLIVYEAASLALACQRRLPREWARAWAWQFQNLPAIRERRQKMQHARMRPDRELLTGGPLPLAPGLITSPLGAAGVRLFSELLNRYWRLVRRMVG
jgi:GT2 family glycosyltransferase